MRRGSWLSVVAGAALVLSGCGGPEAASPSPGGGTASPVTSAPPAAATVVPGSPTPSPGGSAACVTDHSFAPDPAPALPVRLTDVRVESRAGVDRITFAFEGDLMPAFEVAPAEPPFVQDASGLPVDVPGSSFLRIHFPYATGMETYDGPVALSGGGRPGDTLVSLVRTGDFEAVMTWVAGTSLPACVRVETLTGPTRVVLVVEPAD